MSLFRSQKGLFAKIACPVGENCALGNCIYDHSGPYTPVANEAGTKRGSDASTSAAKKRNTDDPKPPAAQPLSAKHTTVKPPSKPAALTPALLNAPPAQHRQRVQFVHVLRDKLVEHGYADAERRAVELELKVAERSTQFTYSMGIRSAVREITTGQLGKEAEIEQETAQNNEKIFRSELVNLLVPLRELEKRRYVTSKPDVAEPDELEDPAEESVKTRPCARCSTRVPLYDLSARTSNCRFHLLKRQFDPAIKRLSPTFPCCGETVDESSGCETRDFHVYKLDAPSEMEAALPFRNTPESSGSMAKEFAVGLDCEMGWTTRGFELIRVTLVGYTSRETIYDRLVWPQGRILDLNTRFSGISSMDEGIELNGQHFPPLALEDMYMELFELIDARTIIIGHGLENDLNALRLIHHRIVDTAILYPRIKHRTHSLKELAWDFLSRTIQTGEHDSMEDSLAAIDIVRQDIKNRCMKGVVKSM